MKLKNDIDELYNLIINSDNHHKTFIDNLELWKDFYEEREILVKKNITDKKLFTIIKFLLKQEKGEIFEFFHSNMMDLLTRKQEYLTFEIRTKISKSEKDISKLFDNLKNHENLCQFLKNNQIKDDFGKIKRYSSKKLELYTISSLIIIIYDQFFNLEPQIVKKILEFISKKTILLQKSDITNHIMKDDLIYQYQDKILPIKQFIGESLIEDELVKQIKTYQIKDKKVLLKLLEEFSPQNIIELFDYDLNNFLTFITSINYINKIEKQEVVNNLFDKIIKEENSCHALLRLIMENNQTKLWKTYITDDRYNKILILSQSRSITDLNSNMIKFLLTFQYKDIIKKKNDYYYISKYNFQVQCQYFVKKEKSLQFEQNFDIEGIKKILIDIENKNNKTITEIKLAINKNDTIEIKKDKTVERFFYGLDIDFDTAMELLNSYLENKTKLNEYSMQAIVRSITTEILEQLEIENNGVYFYDNEKHNGFFSPAKLIIGINRKLITTFLNNELPIYERLKIIEIIFHETRHALINKNKKNNIWDIEAYEMAKEKIPRKYDNNFYKQNYKNIKEEISARINGADYQSKFIETFFPQLLDKIQDQIIETLEKEKNLATEQNSERTMQFLSRLNPKFHLGFDVLIKYNPAILQKYPIFNLEYYPNGIPKSYKDIWLSRTEQNQELIDEILKIRYPDIHNQQINSKHTK